MPKWIVATLLLASFLLSWPTHAHAAALQTPPTLETVNVSLWPEFDRPTMLVIYDITLPQGAALPVWLTFRIPATAGEPNGYGYYVSNQDKPIQDTEGYRYEGSGDWAAVTFKVNSLRATLEYYDPALSKNGAARHFEYTWPGDYAVNTLNLAVQQPPSAEKMRLSAGSQAEAGANGLTYYYVEAGAQAAGATYHLTMDYERSTDRLSVESMQVKPVYPLPEPNLLAALPWVLAILGGVLLLGGGGVYWYLQSGRANPLFAWKAAAGRAKGASSSRKRRRAADPPGSGSAQAGEDGVYCHQCGKRAGSGDLFCRSCGTRLRDASAN